MKVEWEEQGVAVLLPDIVKETTVGKFSLPLPRVASWRDGDCLDRDRNSEWDEQLNFSLLASCITKNERQGFHPLNFYMVGHRDYLLLYNRTINRCFGLPQRSKSK